jgi:hypothetical protein
MLERQNIPVSLAGGLDTKTDEKLVLPGRLTLLENGVFTKGGSVQKRNGYLNLGTSVLGGGTLPTLQALSNKDNELCGFGSDGNLYTFAQGQSAWVNKGYASGIKVTRNPITRNTAQQSRCDSARLLGVAVYAWEDTRGGIRATVVDTATGSQLQSDVSISSSGTHPKVVVAGQSILVLYCETTNLKCRVLSPLSPTTFAAATTVANDMNASPVYDVTPMGLNAICCYRATASGKLLYITQDGVAGTTAVGLPNAIALADDTQTCIAVTVNADATRIFISYYLSGAGLKTVVYAQDFSAVLAPTVVDPQTSPAPVRVTSCLSGTNRIRLYTEYANPTWPYVKTARINAAGAVEAAAIIVRSVGLASKAFAYGDNTYVMVAYSSTVQPSYFLIRSDGSIHAKACSQVAGGAASGFVLGTPQAISSSAYAIPALVATRFVSDAGTAYTLKGVSDVQFDFQGQPPSQARVIGGSLAFPGGMMQLYDGQGATEQGFHVFPENVTATPSASGGSVADGTYTYQVVYEWTDNQGQVHRSSPSIPVLATVTGSGGNGKVTLTIPTLRLTAKKSPRTPVLISIFRTKANQTILYRLLPLASTTQNDPTVDTVTVVDTTNDSSLSGNEFIYTTGGVLENIAAPACAFMDVYQNRMVLVPSEDPLSFWYSKTKIEGEGLAFTDVFQRRIDPLGGEITGIKMMDDKILIFKKNLFFFIAGDGPVDTGAQDNYSVPQIVSTDVGCSQAASLVLVPDGVMFMTTKGIYLCDRSLRVSYIGADVEAYNDSTIVSADLVESTNQVRFLTTSGTCLVYDYYFNRWSTFTNHKGVDGTVWNGSYCYARASGQVYQEAQGHYLDDNLEIKLRMATAWIKTAGIQGFQRVNRFALLGNYGSSHVLRVSIGYDYESTYSDYVIFNAGAVLDQNYYGQDSYYGESTFYGGVADNIYQFRAHLRRQKCQSIRFLFEDVTAGTPGQGYSLSDLSLQVGVKRGLNKLRLQKSVG